MPSFSTRFEALMGALAEFVYAHPKRVLAAAALVVGAAASQLPQLQIDTSTEGFLHPNDATRRTYDHFRDVFGRDELIAVALATDDVFNPGFLRQLKALHDDLEQNVPHIREITSLVNARRTRSRGEELVVDDFLDPWPQAAIDMARLKQEALANPLYVNHLISEDARFATILIETYAYPIAPDNVAAAEAATADGAPSRPDHRGQGAAAGRYLSDADNGRIVDAVKTVVERHRAAGLTIFLAGPPVVIHEVKHAMERDMPRFMAAATLIIAVLLALLFRRVVGVVIPLAIVLISLVTTMGTMAALGIPIKIPTQIVPSFLLAVGIADSVHILALFFHRLDHNADKRAAIVEASRQAGLPILMTSVTTAAGLMSFLGADVAPIADLGLFTTVGVGAALVFTLVIPCALVAILRIRPRVPASAPAGQGSRMDRVLGALAQVSIHRAGLVLILAAAAIVPAIAGACQLRFSQNHISWFPASMAVRQASELVDRELKGSTSVEVVVDGNQPDAQYEPELRRQIELATSQVQKLRGEDNITVGSAIGLNVILREVNRALHDNQDAYYRLPNDRQQIAQGLFLFEIAGSDDIEHFSDKGFTLSRTSFRLPWRDAASYQDVTRRIKARFQDAVGPQHDVYVTGFLPLTTRILSAAISTTRESYLLSVIIIAMLMIIVAGSVKLGLLSMIPNLVPLLLIMGGMGLAGSPLDIFTLLIGSIALGVAVDDTIHFVHNFQRYRHLGHSPEQSVRLTLLSSGRAMVTTSLVLASGFLVFTLATMTNLVTFGVITTAAVLAALAADLLLAPSLMLTLARRNWI
jgi:uncharacterized protein